MVGRSPVAPPRRDRDDDALFRSLSNDRDRDRDRERDRDLDRDLDLDNKKV